MDLIQAIYGIDTVNRFKVLDYARNQVYCAVAGKARMTSNCFGANPEFDVWFKDNKDTEVLHITKPCTLCGCCCACSRQMLEVTSPLLRGQVLGYAKEWSCWTVHYAIENSKHEVVLRIKNSGVRSGRYADENFEIFTPDQQSVVGLITRKWPGYMQEYYTNADNFTIDFPITLSVTTKATILGAIFLIDHRYYKHRNKVGYGSCNRGIQA